MRRAPDGQVQVDTPNGASGPLPGTVAWSEPLPPHTLENVDTTTIRVIGFELKGQARTEDERAPIRWRG